MNLFAFVCELVCIYMWIFETPLTRLDSQMHFFQQGTFCSQSDACLIFRQSHDCSPTRGTSPWPEHSIFSAHFALLFGKIKKRKIRTWPFFHLSWASTCRLGMAITTQVTLESGLPLPDAMLRLNSYCAFTSEANWATKSPEVIHFLWTRATKAPQATNATSGKSWATKKSWRQLNFMQITMTRFSGKTQTTNRNVDALRLRGSQGTPALWFLLDFFGSYCTSKCRLKS